MILDGFVDLEDLKKEYEIEDSDLEGYKVLFACYETGDYCGTSIVILEKDSKLFIVDAGHCSCYGLEGQWDPIETNLEALKKECGPKSRYDNAEFAKLIDFINELDKLGY